MDARKIADNIMAEACLPESLVKNGVHLAIRNSIVAAIERREAVACARIRALWRKTKKKTGEEITTYDWGYKDGLEAARGLFRARKNVKPPSAHRTPQSGSRS